MDRRYVLTCFGYAILGLVLGIYMAASKNHVQLVTYANIMLVGFVVSFMYGLCHRLWLHNISSRLARIQFYLHQAGSALLFLGLFLLYGKFIDVGDINPILAIASVTVLAGLILMPVLFMQSGKEHVSTIATQANMPLVGVIHRKPNRLSKSTPSRVSSSDY